MGSFARLRFPGLRAVAACVFAVPLAAGALRAQEVPPPVPNMQIVKSGSLVIAMDNDKQNLGGRPFNTRAYGLAIELLYDTIPIKWVIRTGKAKDGVDFTATARRVEPDTAAATSLSFAGGPFVIDRPYAARARTRIQAFNALGGTAKVRVYELTQDVLVDVRYLLHFRPYPFVNTATSGAATAVLDAAGISRYHIGDNAEIIASGANACYTILLEPHNSSNSDAPQVRQFLRSGGNFYAQCLSVNTFENADSGHFATTNGFHTANTNAVPGYPNPDMAYSQFVGAVTPDPGGSEQDYAQNAGGVLRTNTSIHVRPSDTVYSAVETRFGTTAVGGIVFYNGGHNYTSTTVLGMINLQRMMLNAVMIPATRPTACSFEILTPDLTISKTHTGNFTVGTTGTYSITVTNSGTSATLDTIYVRDTLPVGLTFASWSGTGWSVTVDTATRLVLAKYPGTLAIGATATFSIVVNVGGLARVDTNRVWVNGGGDGNDTNNGARDPTTIVALGVTVTPDSGGPVAHLPSNGVEYSYVFTVKNTGTSPSAYDLLTTLGTADTAFLTIDSITGPTVTRGTLADSARLATLAAGDSALVTVWFRIADVSAGLRQLEVLTARSTVSAIVTDPGSAVIEVARPGLTIDKQVAPTGEQSPGTDLTYTVVVQNVGSEAAVSVVVVDSIPPEVMFKVGSIVNTLPAGTAAVEYSNDEGATWTYTPVSEGCGAPADFDACVNRIRWTLSLPLAFASGSNTATHVLIARLR